MFHGGHRWRRSILENRWEPVRREQSVTADALTAAYAEFAEKQKGSREHRQIRELGRLQTGTGV